MISNLVHFHCVQLDMYIIPGRIRLKPSELMMFSPNHNAAFPTALQNTANVSALKDRNSFPFMVNLHFGAEKLIV